MCKTHFISSFNCSDSPYPFFFPSLLQVNFSYVEAGEQKQALVKLVACKRKACLQEAKGEREREGKRTFW